MMDIAVFILIVIALVGLLIFLMKWEARIKNTYREKAKNLLDMSDPDLKEVRDTIRHLRLYSGRIFKDKDTVRLADSLREKYGHLL